MVKLRRIIVITLIALPGCSHQPAGNPAGTAAVPTSGPEVTFQTADGWTIHGDYYPAPRTTKESLTNKSGHSPSRAVILLHQRGGSAADWLPVVQQLNAEGISVLAIDQRGAGRSTGAQNGNDAPWDTSGDIDSAMTFLGSQKGYALNDIGIAGASYGANNALLYAAKHPVVRAIAALSPGKDYHGLAIEGQSKNVKGSLLVMTAKDDSITEGGPQIIKKDAPGAELQEYSGSAHGTDLFTAHPETVDKLAAFFNRAF